ncbi:hypothetical protein Tco_0353359 [Tanacetum coccineum]
MSRSVPKGKSRSVPEGMSRSVPKGMSRSVPKGMSRLVPEGMSRSVPKGMSRSVPKGMSISVPTMTSEISVFPNITTSKRLMILCCKVKSAAAKMAHSKSVYLVHTYEKQKQWDEKETEDKIKEGTLKVDHGTDAMTVVLGKEKGGYARGVGSGVTYKRGAVEVNVNSIDTTRCVLVNINPIDSNAYEEGQTPLSVVGCENDAGIQKSNGLETSEKERETRETVNSVGSKKTTKSLRKESSHQDFQSLENVSPLQVLPQAIKYKLWHLKKTTIIALGTIYKTDEKQMLHNKELPKDYYKVLVDKSLVDAACIPDVGNNGFKTVNDAVGGFFA